MSITIQLLGRPRIVRGSRDVYKFRSRKSWALLTYLILSERPPPRSQLASLLFADADDPVRALRWSLSEIRRALGGGGSVDGDPVVLSLPAGTVVDAAVVTKGAWTDAVRLPGLGADPLDGMTVRGGAAFETWLLSQQRHLAAASEAILHEAALGSMARGAVATAIGYAVRAATMSPLDENHQALLIRLYRMAGDNDAAAAQLAAFTRTLRTELGAAPGPAVQAAMRDTPHPPGEATDDVTIEAITEAGTAAVSAGAVEAGIGSLRTAAELADRAGAARLRVSARLMLAEALIHTLGGLDEAGLAALHEADQLALAHELTEDVAQVRAELGYVDFLRGHYDRAEFWLTDALTFASGSPSVRAKAMTYLGAVESDRASYRNACGLLAQAVSLSQAAGEPRRQAFGLALLGRVSLFRGSLDTAAVQLDEAIELAERDHWLAFLPWPQALRGEVQLARGDPAGASESLQQAFARACQLGDPCWEGMSARGLALVAEAAGDTERAFTLLFEARARCHRLADPYVWLDGYILDAQCELGRRHGHPDTMLWVQAMQTLAARTGMKELALRSLRHGAALGSEGDAAAAAILAAEIEADGAGTGGIPGPPAVGRHATGELLSREGHTEPRTLARYVSVAAPLGSGHGVVDRLAGLGGAAGGRRSHDGNAGPGPAGRRGGGRGRRRRHRPWPASPARRIRRRRGGWPRGGETAGGAPYPAAPAAAVRNVRTGRAVRHRHGGSHGTRRASPHRR
jgi:DNA-binding SARP family transcriptional activator